MDNRTVVAWLQLVAGALQVTTGYTGWRAGRTAGKSQIASGVAIIAFGVALLTTGWVRAAAWAICVIGAVWMTWRTFTARDRFGIWSGLVLGVLCLPIAIAELAFDQLNGWQTALFAGLALVMAALVVTMTVRLVRSYTRIKVPSV